MPYDCSKTTGATFGAQSAVLQPHAELYSDDSESSDEEEQSPEPEVEGVYRKIIGVKLANWSSYTAKKSILVSCTGHLHACITESVDSILYVQMWRTCP